MHNENDCYKKLDVEIEDYIILGGLLNKLKSEDLSDKDVIAAVESVWIERIISTERVPLPKVSKMKEKNRWRNWYNQQVDDIKQQS